MKIRPHPTITPLLFFLFGVVGTVLLHQMVEGNERRRIGMETGITAEQVRLRIEAWVDSRTALVEHLGAGQFEDAADLRENFDRRALTFVDLYPGIQALNFIDRKWVIRRVVPAGPNAAALDKDLHVHPNPGVPVAVRKSQETGDLTRTPIIDLLQSGKGFATYHPLRDREGLWLGFVNGVFRINELFDTCLYETELRDRFSFYLIDDDSTIAYQHQAVADPPYRQWGVQVPVRIVDRDWTLHLVPNPAYLAEAQTPADEAMALIGVLSLAVLALLLRLLLIRQEALRQSQAKYRLLVENQSDLVVKLDPQGNFRYVSPSFCEAFDCSERDILGTNFLPLVHPDDRENTAASLRSLAAPPHHSYNEQRSLTPGGTVWHAWTNSAVLAPDGSLEAITASGRDITRRRELEEQLVFSRKMQAVGQLAGGIAHDFNNLLQAMLGNLQFVVQDTSPTGQTANDLGEIEKGINRAMLLTRQLLAFSRKQDLHSQPEDLNQIVGQTVGGIRRTLRSVVGLEFNPADQPLPVRVDRSQIEQILRNLCDNARDAIVGSGTITICTAVRTVREHDLSAAGDVPPGDYAMLVVSDTGHGMKPEVLDRIFEPFYSTREVGAGVGLGLATTFGIVQQHRGTVLAASVVGQGSTLTVLLPLDLDVEYDQPTAAQPATSRGETVLLAEDDVSVRELAVRVLERANYVVLAAENGQQAVDVFTAHQNEIDLVMLDMVMPGLNGREAHDRIAALRPGVPILFASGYDPASLDGAGLDAAGIDVLMKPYGIPDLLRKVREILDRTESSGGDPGG